MKKIIAIILLSCVGSGAIAQNQLSPEEYYNESRAVLVKVSSLGRNWEEKFSDYTTSAKNLSRYKDALKSANEFITLKRQEFQNLAAAGKGGKKMKDAFLVFLNSESKIISTSFESINSLTTSSSAADLEEAHQQLRDQVRVENVNVQNMFKALDEYGDKNGIEMPAPEMAPQ